MARRDFDQVSETFDIREAVAADVPELVGFLIRLDAHVGGVDPEILELTPTGEQQLRQRIESYINDPGKRLAVAETDDGRLVGMGGIHIWHYADIWVNPERRGLRSGYIDDLWVEPDFRSAGVARRILDALLAFAQAEGIDELTLEYALHNPEAEAFWQKLGFKPTGVRAAGRLDDVRARLGSKTPAAKRTPKKPKAKS